MPSDPVRVMVVDDDQHIRRMLTRIIKRNPRLELVGEASDGDEALPVAREGQPQILLTDVDMERVGGVQLARQIRSEMPELKILALTGAEDWETVAAMVRAGASGYLVKTASPEEIANAILSVARGFMVLSPEIAPLILSDLVEHYRHEQARAEALADLDQMKRDFMNTVSHELRTPVTIIKGGSQTLRRRSAQLDEEARVGFYESIERQADRLQRLINQVLIVSRIESRGFMVGQQRTSFADALTHATKTIGADQLDRVDVQMGSESVVADQKQLGDVISWVLDNALRFTTGPVIVRSSRVDNQGVLEIVDEGPGMTPDVAERVLAVPFTQADNSTTREKGGLGVSLYAARQVVESGGGTLRIESDPEKGTNVSIWLPLADGDNLKG